MTRIPLVRRVITEHRRAVIGLAAVFLANILAYVFLVMPLSRQVADVAGRDERAARALLNARREHDQAAGTLTGKDRAATELTTFYQDVLPSDVSSARRLVYLRLHQLAREAGLKYVRGTNETAEERSSTLTRLKTEMELAGSYASMRTFIHQLETAPEFVVIDNIELTEDDAGSELKVKLNLSTYLPQAMTANATDKARRQLYLLGGLVAVLAVVLYVSFGRSNTSATVTTPAGSASPPSNQAASTGGGAGIPVSDVRLDALKHDESELDAAERNPFRFQQKAAPPPPPQRPVEPRQTFAPPPVATGPPPPPPIPLKYVGLLGAAAPRDRVVVLADARGNTFYGKEGDVVEGRYRVLRVATDSVDVAYADGRGRQTIRLSSQ